MRSAHVVMHHQNLRHTHVAKRTLQWVLVALLHTPTNGHGADLALPAVRHHQSAEPAIADRAPTPRVVPPGDRR